MPTRPKADPASLRKRILRVIAQEVKDIEALKKKNKGQVLDAKTGQSLITYVKQLNDLMDDDERRASKLLADAAKLNVAELVKRAGVAPEPEEDGEEVEEDGDGEVLPGREVPDAEAGVGPEAE